MYIVFGPYIFSYHTFSYSLKSVLFFALGQLDTEEMVSTNAPVAVIWSYILFFFLLFIFLSIFMAIFVAAYEGTVRENGYPSDFMDMAKWEYKDYLEWMVEWLPDKLLKKIFKKQNMHQDEDGGAAGEGKGTDDKDDKDSDSERFKEL